ncbi:hypothetical protein OkiPb00122_32670 [Escherichia coli]|nr:hypothetical protein EC33884_A0025 [Escherichia coli 3.3884]BDW25487.1 hypothetical protein JNE082640_p10750 [Escherichia coli]BDW57509.1 hypothetical protein JNE120393_49400 [Escherichia coli]BDW62384.1 hypothetical protein JNE120442_48280 [Escherichia coli]BDW67302.1 hypothetical protein JNE141411_48970 [Escherichia coli]
MFHKGSHSVNFEQKLFVQEEDMKILFAFVMNWLFVNGQIMTRSSMFAGGSPGVGTRSPR